MKCPECKAEVKHPCWVGPVATYKGIPVHACGMMKDSEILTLKEIPEGTQGSCSQCKGLFFYTSGMNGCPHCIAEAERTQE